MDIAVEVRLFFSAVYTGIMAYCFYQILVILRKCIPHSAIVIDLEDLLYWIFLSRYIFHRVFVLMDGVIRLFFVVGVILGALLMGEMKRQLRVPFEKACEKWRKHLENRLQKM